ncbi:aldo/keto reductase [Alphaproteobacteria bacterium]|nr:aldo/keto reductase [Alphaproteobacteria bacterium]
MQNIFSKIILGTVQMGVPYGLGRWQHELMPEKESFAILDAAWERGITTLDTSPEYGVAEARIAKYMRLNTNKPFHIISKIKNIPIDSENDQPQLQSWIENSPFHKLNSCASLSLLLHKEKDIYRSNVIDQLDSLIHKKKLFSWGVSVYEEDAARYAANIESCLLVQLPFGVLNQAFGRKGTIQLLSNRKKIVMARSIFLQGLLLKSDESLLGFGEEIFSLITTLRKFLTKHEFAINDFAITFASMEKGISNLVLGADDAVQLLSWKTDLELLKQLILPQMLMKDLRHLDEHSLKPQSWKKIR